MLPILASTYPETASAWASVRSHSEADGLENGRRDSRLADPKPRPGREEGSPPPTHPPTWGSWAHPPKVLPRAYPVRSRVRRSQVRRRNRLDHRGCRNIRATKTPSRRSTSQRTLQGHRRSHRPHFSPVLSRCDEPREKRAVPPVTTACAPCLFHMDEFVATHLSCARDAGPTDGQGVGTSMPRSSSRRRNLAASRGAAAPGSLLK